MESIFNSSDHEVITEKQLEFDLYQEFFSNGAAPNGPNAGQTEVNPGPFMTLQPQNLTFSEDEAQNNIDFILKCEFCDRIYRGKYAEITLRKHISKVHGKEDSKIIPKIEPDENIAISQNETILEDIDTSTQDIGMFIYTSSIPCT